LAFHAVWVVGHVTRDRIRTAAGVDERAGGTATYFPLALARLGGEVGVLTRVAERDRDELLAEHRAESLDVVCGPSDDTTVFELCPADDPEGRSLRADSVALPFAPDDLLPVGASLVHLGPLTRDDMSCEFLRAAAACARVSLDVQGLVRRVDGGRVELCDWTQKREVLPLIGVLKANEMEAELLTSESDPLRAARRLASWGPDEVVVTLGGRGSLVLCDGRLERIRAFEVDAPVDPTGCGDTYMGAYLGQRLAGWAPGEAARFASGAAALKLRASGPLRATRESVERLVRG
jgi:sugar/nucleoside kinase (ribokinase family)